MEAEVWNGISGGKAVRMWLDITFDNGAELSLQAIEQILNAQFPGKDIHVSHHRCPRPWIKEQEMEAAEAALAQENR